MVYTLTQGAQRYDNRLHYSLYGGVEHFPEHSFALKELLPLIAIPTVAIATLAAIINFHIPILSPAAGGNGKAVSQSGSNSRSIVLSSAQTKASSPARNNAASSQSIPSPSGSLPNFTGGGSLAPLGNDNGQGIIGGMGSGGGSTTPLPSTDPTGTVPAPTTTPIDVQVNTQPVQADATVTPSTQQPQAGVDVIAPATGTNISAGLTL